MNDEDEKGWASVPTLGGEEAELAPALPGQILRRADGGLGPASCGDIATTACETQAVADGGGPTGTSVVTETVTLHSGRETTYHLAVGQQPTTVGQRTTVVAQQATVALRERLRAALRRHIDPDDDTMPALWRGDGFIWLAVDSVLDDLVRAVGIEQLAADRDQAAATVERVRAECAAIGTPHICNAVDRILAVLDQPEEQP